MPGSCTAHGKMSEEELSRGLAAAGGAGDRHSGLHHHHRDRRGRAQLQYPHHRGRRPHGPFPALPAPGPGGPLAPAGPTPTSPSTRGKAAHRGGGKSGFPPSGSSPPSVPASALPCGTWRSAAPAMCWAPSSTDTWRPWATICTCGCWERPSPNRRAKPPSAPVPSAWWIIQHRRPYP